MPFSEWVSEIMPRQPGFIRSARMRLVGTSPTLPPETCHDATARRPASMASDSHRAAPSSHGSIYRPLIVGPAILHRLPRSVDSQRRWQVDVAPGPRFLPDAPSRALDVERVVSWRSRVGEACRAAAALVSSVDLSADGPSDLDHAPGEGEASFSTGGRFVGRGLERPRGAAIEMYGWALMYQLPGDTHRAWVDRHEDHDELPAYFESPLELLDRATFLAARGVRTRPIALITRPDDFVDSANGPVNRFYPTVRFRPPVPLRRLF